MNSNNEGSLYSPPPTISYSRNTKGIAQQIVGERLSAEKNVSIQNLEIKKLQIKIDKIVIGEQNGILNIGANNRGKV